ncbi:MAG: lipid-A-disaccharide synthase [Alphaproteobacteria bacterium]|nr:lipid-A-disaccharide synthase [Alphaproteobacteria bacterium]
MAGDVPHLMLIAGEPSGDALGGQLMASLRLLTDGRIRITGSGGEAMTREGLVSLFPISDTSVMGLKEVAPRVPLILRRVREMADEAIRTRPDAVVLIDSPDFTHRIGRRLKRLAPEIRIIKYVAPQVWGSRPWRARSLAQFVDLLLALLPFEPPFFESYGLRTVFVGHPVVERAAAMTGGDAFRARHGIGAGERLVLVLPGSRVSEVRLLLPLFAEAMHMVASAVPSVRICIPAVAHVRQLIEAGLEAFPVRPLVVGADEKFAAFDAGDVALAASGTVSTELALARTPMVIGYRVGWLTGEIFRRLLTAPFATLVNLIARDGVIPEFLQESCTPEALADELVRLLTDPGICERQLAGIGAALAALGLNEAPPSERAARAILDAIGSPGQTSSPR